MLATISYLRNGRKEGNLRFEISSKQAHPPIELAFGGIEKLETAARTHAPCASGEAVDIRDRLEIFYSRPSSFSRP